MSLTNISKRSTVLLLCRALLVCPLFGTMVLECSECLCLQYELPTTIHFYFEQRDYCKMRSDYISTNRIQLRHRY